MPGGPFPPCMAGSAASGTRWDESCHSWHSPIIPHWESSCLACVRANCPVVPAPLTTNGSNPGHYQSEHWTIKGKSVCFVWSFHLPIEIVPSKWYTTLNPERMKVLCFLWRCFPFVWNRQHLQQATKAVQGPESQATKQLASVPAQKKKVLEKAYWMLTMQISKSQSLKVIFHLWSVYVVYAPLWSSERNTVCPPSLGTVWSQIKRPCDFP